jgi:membrane protein DedA with SNARE-associated domain
VTPDVAAIIAVSSGLGYLLPAVIGLESLGIPSPGEAALILAAVLASQGKLQIELVIVIAAVSEIIGGNLGYLLGRRVGREVLEAEGPFQARRLKLIAFGDHYFAKHGAKTVFLGRWIALVRFAIAWLAGIDEMPFRTFLFWNALSAVSWTVTYSLVGYFGGSGIADVITKVGIGAAVVVGVAIVVGVGWLKLRARRRPDLPPA